MESGTLSTDMLGQLRRSASLLSVRGALEAIHLASRVGLAPSKMPRGVIFTLHHVRDDVRQGFSPNAHLTVTPAFLESVIKTVRVLGYRPVALEQLPDLLSKPEDGTRFAAFTLDDGYRNNLTEAYPVFRRHDTPFTVFVTEGFVRRTRSIWWMTLEELMRGTARIDSGLTDGMQIHAGDSLARRYALFDKVCNLREAIEEDDFIERIDHCAQANGIDPLAIVDREVLTEQELKDLCTDGLATLGAHTVNHPNLARTSLACTEDEMKRSASYVRSLTGRPTAAFCYPYGGRDAACEREFDAARSCGFELAVTTRPGALETVDAENRFALPRLSLNGYYQKVRYIRALLTGMPIRLASTLRYQG